MLSSSQTTLYLFQTFIERNFNIQVALCEFIQMEYIAILENLVLWFLLYNIHLHS